MRPLLGPLVLHLGLLVAGLGVLRAAGVVRPLADPRSLAAVGLAYLVGVAAAMQACVLLLVLGAPFGLLLIAAVIAVLSAPLLLELRHLPRLRVPRPRLPRLGFEGWVAALVVAGFAVFVVLGVLATQDRPLDGYDAWNIWTRKAALLVVGDGLPLAFLTAPNYGGAHPDYPIVLPLLEAAHLRAVGGVQPSAVHVVFWLLLAAFVAGGAFLAARSSRPLVWSTVLPAAALLCVGLLVTAYADVPVAIFLGLGVLALGTWLESGRRSDLAVAGLLLAGAAGIKNEGLIGAVLALAVGLAVVAAARRGRALRDLAVASVLVAGLAIVPWRLWLGARGIEGDLPLLRGLDPAYLAGRTERIWPAVVELQKFVATRASVGVFISLGLAAALLVAVRDRPRRPVAVFYVAVGLGYYASLLWAYWISPLDITFHVVGSANRVSVALGLIAMAGLLQLVGSSPRGDYATRSP